MKTLSILCTLFMLAIVVVKAQPPKGPVTPGTTFGSSISADGAMPVADLSNVLQDDQPHTVKVKGTVTDVCPKKGCWISLEMPGNSKVFVKMKDYGFFVPVELIGKTVVIDAEAKVIKTSVDELKHYAEDAKKSKEEIDAIKESKEEIRLTANGILVLK
ncbi:DUF4920 domain-containing protein [Ohtaekwangia kribbensis]|uniref:DUF4920 domain-containing protein n=1 Tax=Ohtaekwangia kribbensis TaxID=688913 RepID=A0ABW3KCK8_9BACT